MTRYSIVFKNHSGKLRRLVTYSDDVDKRTVDQVCKIMNCNQAPGTYKVRKTKK